MEIIDLERPVSVYELNLLLGMLESLVTLLEQIVGRLEKLENDR